MINHSEPLLELGRVLRPAGGVASLVADRAHARQLAATRDDVLIADRLASEVVLQNLMRVFL